MDTNMRGTVRTFATKMPHYFFSAYPTVYAFPTFLTSYDDFNKIIDQNLFLYNPTGKQNYLDIIEPYNYSYGIPKSDCFVKLDPHISDNDREFVLNGIRTKLDKSDTILATADILSSLDTLNLVFNIFLAIVALITLFIAFFLLLISMTQNINDAVWEYGVLRSMGLMQDEGVRIYLYEAFAIVVSSSVLGILIGFITSLMIASQFFMFIEMPLTIFFPVWILVGMLSMAGITTFVAVYKPMRDVNKRRIAAVLKSGSV